MNVTVNGKPMTLEENTSVIRLIEVMELGQKRVAVEVNKELAVKKVWAETILKEGDKIEIVTFVGGG